MIRSKHKEKKKLSFRIIIDLLNTNRRNILLLDDTVIKILKAEIS